MDKEKYHEQLSALMDEELNEQERDQLFSFLKKDPELLSTWDRYHLIQAFLQEENLFKEDFKKALRQKIKISNKTKNSKNIKDLNENLSTSENKELKNEEIS